MASNSGKSIRIKANPNNPTEKYITAKLDQDFEKIEVLSLTLKQQDIYRSFSSDYGVLVGRCSSNQTGIPNVKVSVFIPISDEDKANPDKVSIYPYSTPLDKNNQGKRFNLLRKLKSLNPFSGFKENNYGIGYKPKVDGTIGSIPDKVELLTNNTWLEVYQDYYKYTTVTNSSGDYMIFGVPIGDHIIHCEVDTTDIGKYSTSIPVLAQVQGLSENLFSDDGTKLKPITDLDQIPTIQAQNVSTNIVSFWGDPEIAEIGITRQDFNLRIPIIPSATLFGSSATQSSRSFWGDRIIWRAVAGLKNLCIFIGCSKEQLGESPGVAVKFCFRLHLKFKSFTIIDQCIGACELCDPNATLSMKICIKIVIANIIPLFCVDSVRFAPCQLNGGEFDQGAVDILWLGATSKCGNCTDIQTESDAAKDNLTTLLDLDDCRYGDVKMTVFGIKPSVSDTDILSNNFDIRDDIEVLSENRYANIKSASGSFLTQLPCNRKKVITDDLGNEIETDDPNLGTPTEFWGYIIFEMPGLTIDTSGSKIIADRVRIKVPACTNYNEDGWVKSAYRFQANQVYTVSQYMLATDGDGKFTSTRSGLILDVTTTDPNLGADMEMAYNNQLQVKQNTSNIFINNWLNGFLFFYQVAHKRKKGKRNDVRCGVFLSERGDDANGNQRTRDNSSPLGGSATSNRYILNNQYFQTNFVKIDKDELIDVLIPTVRRGFIVNNPSSEMMRNSSTTKGYFYKGLYEASNSLTQLIKKDII